MSVRSFYTRLAGTRVLGEFLGALDALQPGASVSLYAASGSLPAFLVAHAFERAPRTLCCITEDEESAAFLASDLEQILGSEHVIRFPVSGHAPYDSEHVEDVSLAIARAEALQRLAEGPAALFVLGLDALLARVPSGERLAESTWTLATGDTISPQAAVERLHSLVFNRVEFAESPGDMALRGGILDVYPFTGDYPLRIEFFGDDVDSLREFDPRTQRSVSRLTHARIVPDLEADDLIGGFASFFDYLSVDTPLVTLNEGRFEGLVSKAFQHQEQLFQQASRQDSSRAFPLPADRYITPAEFQASVLSRPRIQIGTFQSGDADASIDAGSRPQPVFNKNVETVRRNVAENASADIDTVILCDSHGQVTRLIELLESSIRDHRLELKVGSIHQGFVLPEAGLALYTDHQIFDRYHRPTRRKQKRSYGGLTLREVQNLRPGDFVVHIDYGVGRFAGLFKITVREKQQEAVKLLFKDDDVLYVNVNALHKLHKFSGKEGHQPSLTKLGSGQWERTKARTKKRVKDIARDLIRLYAKRKASDGY
ncbi:MAG: CarD family transcriptional regulator, partial [Bacteroidota bacterium]